MDPIATLEADPRVRVRRAGPADPAGRCVVYWMQRAQRASDNPALDVAVRAANALGLPIVAYFGLIPRYPGANERHYRFLAEGLPELAEALADRGVGFVLRRWPEHQVERFCEEVRAALVVGDENPLREPERWRVRLSELLRVPLWTVDADVVVPSALLEKEQYAARTIRPRIHRLLPRFLVSVPEPRPRHRWTAPQDLLRLDPREEILTGLPLDRSAAPVQGLHGGAAAGRARLQGFLRQGLAGYHRQRNRPELEGTSRLSPYLHFGQLGPRSIALAVGASEAPHEDRAAFLEELIVRRELAINFVRYNPAYDRLQSCEPWALRTLEEHRRDPRPLLLDEQALEEGETPDPLWNAAQRQMVATGWMHGYVRMYWAKQLLLWTRDAARAFELALLFNDRYELDGRDPNGYAGVAWAIGGKHDRAWGPERPIFGKVRFMSFASTSRKFDWRAYARGVAAGDHG